MGMDHVITARPQGHTYGDVNIHDSNAHFGDVNYYVSDKPEDKGRCLRDADVWIHDNRYAADRLKIERLSGDLLPIDRCYINLAIVEQPSKNADSSEGLDKGDTASQPSPFSLLARLKIETIDKKIQVELPTIFSPRKRPDGQTTHPRRILIRGRAGVGKTTLCKKSVHDYITCGIWSDLFDRVLWIPLRRLKGRRGIRYNLGELFYDEYFSQRVDGRSLSNALWHALDTNGDRSLFILDGLDEVSQVLDGDDDMSHFLMDLLNQPNAIITSRPYGKLPAGLRPLDIELETIGFYPDQMKDYLRTAFTNPKRVGEVWSFLQQHWLIQGLVRIPIQLDALCYTWDDSNSGAIPQTTTTAYKAIEHKLWKKDVLRLQKKHGEELVKKGQIQEAGPSKIERLLVKDEISFLEGLAFTGLHNDVIEFEPKFLDDISDHFAPILLLNKTLPCLSFLRTSDPSSDDPDRNYHFLHLTFQEYFAARYFVRCWVFGQQLSYLKLGSTKRRSMSEIPAEKFLQREKYNGRYDIFWRFVAGLLWDHDEEQLHKFFEQIEHEPRDLLGPVHQRLLMHCFNEVALPDSEFLLTGLRRKMEHRCQQWSIYEYKHFHTMHLCRESEFPDKLLIKMLTEGSNNERTIILKALQGRSQLSDNVLKEVTALLKYDTDLDVRRSAVEALRKQSLLSDNIIQALITRLEHTEWYIMRSAIQALGNQSSLPDSVVQALMARLEDTDSDVRRFTVDALGKQSLLPDNVVQALMERLEDTDSIVRDSAVKALGKQPQLSGNISRALRLRLRVTNLNVSQPSLPGGVVQAPVLRLGHPCWYFRRPAVNALGKQSSLSDNVIQALMARLNDTNSDVRDSVVRVLGKQSSLLGNVVQALVPRLKDTDSDVRRSTVDALGNQSSLSDNVVQALVSRLEDTDSGVRCSTVNALGKQSSLSDNIVQALMARLEHTEWYIRCSTIQALGNQSSLPDNVVQALVSRLEDTNLNVRCSAVKVVNALGRQSSLPDNVVQALVSRLEDTDWYVRRSAVDALGNQSSLSDNVIQALVSRLEDTNLSVRFSAVKAVDALGKQYLLPDNVVQALMERLEDTDSDVRRFVVDVLGKQSSLPDNIVQALVARLKDTNLNVRCSAVEALGKQSLLSDNIVQALMTRLEDTNSIVRRSVVKALGKQSLLPDNIVHALVARLRDTTSIVRDSAVKALRKQPSLPDNVMQALMSRLEDTDSDVRRSAADALGKQSSLSDNIVQALASRLEHTHGGVRVYVVQTLGNQSSLPDNIVQALVSRLEDTDSDVRRSAVKALWKQSSLSDNIIQALVSRLKDTDSDIRDFAAQALDSDRFYSILPSLSTHTLQILYRRWVERSIVEQFSCYIQDGNLYIEMPNRRKEISLQRNSLLMAFLAEASAMGRPGS